MTLDYVYGNTKPMTLETEENDIFVVADPGTSRGLIITDLTITIKLEPDPEFEAVFDEKLDLVLHIDDGENVYPIANIDVMRLAAWEYKSVGLLKYWNGGRLVVTKNFPGRVTVAGAYIPLSSKTYSLWVQ